ncbi:SDR family NAD(P)-dependent oxidoreductase [Pedobacter sp. HMF7647]|uniref:SDR family NAD(P)-dependent oxidoreductase n=1 Tax=Hufsiella arboris TaxID=2695275 RepID=A0A7K1YAC9_9SPHI|nr:SDR family NAD(P)-dependent oxidoreductase [Hufsiella arboris]MXV51028.1 SDR family NAD(P)-dependent oxidoreductase [Hufsiella arboris]
MIGKKVWLVTGASKGLGLSLIKRLLDQGYSVAATSRDELTLKDSIDCGNDQFLALKTDLTDKRSINRAIDTAVEKFGRIDVVVNNAGYGIGGTVEELNEKEIADSFNINVFAPIYVMQEVLPHFRKQRSGHIINISSIAGFAPASGWAMYAATKYALTGLSEVLADDLKEFGIFATVVAPGAFSTQFLSSESLVLSKNSIADYTNVRNMHAKYLSMNGTQIGDPGKAAEVFIRLAEMKEPPVRLFLGSDSYNRAYSKLETLEEELNKWMDISFSTDFIKEEAELELKQAW